MWRSKSCRRASRDGDRIARFDREAKALAALNHPNIAQIYGVEERALVMELVEGEPLRGPLPLETDSARQIAEALEAEHEKGIPLTPHIPCIRIDPVRQRAQGRVCGMEEPVPARFRHSCLYRKANKLGGTSGRRHGKALEPAVYWREKRVDVCRVLLLATSSSLFRDVNLRGPR